MEGELKGGVGLCEKYRGIIREKRSMRRCVEAGVFCKLLRIKGDRDLDSGLEEKTISFKVKFQNKSQINKPLCSCFYHAVSLSI